MHARRELSALCLGAIVATPCVAQRLLLDDTRITLTPGAQRVTLGAPLAHDNGTLTGLTQSTLQFGTSVALTSQWTLDATVAFATGRVSFTDSTGAAADLTLSGLADTKVRMSGRPLGDAVTIVVSANLPTGRTRLSETQLSALRVVGSPALRLTVPMLGLGPGGSAGIVYSFRLGAWAVGTGASYEMRGQYSPLEGAIVGVNATSQLDPGDLVRASIGADRVIGQHRLSTMVSTEFFGNDNVRTIITGVPESGPARTYQLGPTVSASAQLAIATTRVQRLTAFLSSRYRTRTRGEAGVRLGGSAGNQLDAGIEVVTGSPRGIGVVTSLQGRWDTGLGIDRSITTAGVVGASLTTGVVLPFGRLVVQPSVNGGASSLSSGAGRTGAITLGGALTMTVRP